ncbi:5cf29832-387b-4e8b-ad6c-037fc21a3452 [Sclerotinia trifoliorum]|uniref:5cf29832-387b-4e8b-ad6c-037fc21a3452 n=1 Tax=Sclerotinia trifoliorum TaxID=28548 RepID=A0A8H2W324_9HELO|nr:5cf29832-387b-4e8b-ad6c-037fc21a3452 [Sclerotinia trifoliorum]
MSASQNQSSLNSTPAGTTFGPNSGAPSSTATPGMSVGSATAMGHGHHPKDNADDSNAKLPGSKYGPRQEDLDGEQMRMSGEGEVMAAQFDKKNAGWGEEGSYTSDLDRQKAEQKEAREKIKSQRAQGLDVDGGGGGRLANENVGSV